MNHFESERTGRAGGREVEMKFARPWIVAGLLLTAPGAQAQLLSSSGNALGQVGGIVPNVLNRVEGTLDQSGLDRLSPARLADRLVAVRAARIDDLLRRHADSVELDDRREPARRGVILLTGAGVKSIEALRTAGYGVENAAIEGLDLSIARLIVPQGRSLSRALKQVRSIAPEAQASADNLYFPSGPSIGMTAPALAEAGPVRGKAAGLIDGGVARHPALSGPVEQQGFARGAPRASSHGTAVASLISGAGSVRGAAPGVPLLVADVYGDDPAGGGAFAIARALGWMAARGASVVTVSLVGPDNPLLAGAIRLARDKGVTVVAAVGNDGPAAPPAYPASYPDVIAVTGIDGRGRVLPEAGRARHVDFAAPGADMNAARPDGGKGRVRGTSFAAPLVAGRLFATGSVRALRSEAKSGAGPAVICSECRNID
ncbi:MULTISPECIES: S8 family serine peptidase [unclassified Sphingobium]|uniref:S8 family serine peptidase n=1 Tax=unclassified Sphingobium TaxID=2611147 RepID=UPI000833D14E|nr:MULTISPECIES: S8 family serine peptidase [unclassified Sphingobium]NML90103.1 S8 family serine peptidase [Sphingobium sp. TB-6]